MEVTVASSAYTPDGDDKERKTRIREKIDSLPDLSTEAVHQCQRDAFAINEPLYNKVIKLAGHINGVNKFKGEILQAVAATGGGYRKHSKKTKRRRRKSSRRKRKRTRQSLVR